MFERLACGATSGGPADDAETGARLQAWCLAAADGDARRFAKRLRRDGLSEETVRPALARSFHAPDDSTPGASTDGVEQVPLPAWTTILAGIFSAAETDPKSLGQVRRCLDPGSPLPFEELLLPMVSFATGRLRAGEGERYASLAESARVSLERALLRRLANLCGQTLELNFSVFRSCRDDANAFALEQALGPGRMVYEAFAREMLAHGWRETLLQYPVLARLIATLVGLWVESSAEFLSRLAEDRRELENFFAVGELGPVVQIATSLSDPHRGGRTVLAVTFGSGLKLVYKPKDLGLEAAYARLQAWLNTQGAPLELKVLKVLDRATHGWVEFVEHRPCENAAAAGRYYQRAGMQLCLLHLLETTDCHQENLIACGEQPVLVDLETLLHHRDKRPATTAPSAALMANDQMVHSVLRVGLLPRWDINDSGQALDTSGLGGVGEQEITVTEWVAVNTDGMKRARARQTIQPGGNTPLLAGRPLPARDFLPQIVAGFEAMHRFLCDHREALLAPAGPLAGLAGKAVRVLVRHTRTYAQLHDRLAYPRFLEDGARRGIELDALARAFLGAEENPFWPVVKAEREAMEQLDIPYFTARPDSDAIMLGTGWTVPGCFVGPSLELARARLASLNETELAFQTGLIRGALFSRASGAIHQAGSPVEIFAAPGESAPLLAEGLVASAVAIAEAIVEGAIRSPDGGATWIAPVYLPEVERFQFQPLGVDLYGGSPGVGLFLTAAAGVTGRDDFREAGLGALTFIRQAVRDPNANDQRWVRELGIGGATGWGAVVYALTRAAGFLRADDLLDDAALAAAHITPARIAADESLDVLSGAAGAVLALLALHTQSGDSKLVEAALLCGRRLLAARVASREGPRVWPAARGGRPLTGFSHGAAGMAHALLKLHAATGETSFRDAAIEAMEYERAVFDPRAGNWPDFRTRSQSGPGAQPFMTSWCHGAPGIGLARLGSLRSLGTPEAYAEIETALATTAACPLDGVDHLCCGHAGRVELLIKAAETMGRPELLAAARQRAARIVARARAAGDFQLHQDLPAGVQNPGLFTGSAGIGYQFLRLARPDTLPSVLLWE